MKKYPLWPFFLISLFFTFYSGALLPTYTFLSFAPFLAIAFNRYTLPRSLWLAASCGLIMDLLSSLTPFGFHALIYVIVTFCLYRFRLFFVEKALGLSSFTVIFSLLSTLLERSFLNLFEISLPLTWKGIVSDFLIMPLLDGFYAFLWFSCPLMLYHLLRRQWFRFLFFRKETKKKREEPVG